MKKFLWLFFIVLLPFLLCATVHIIHFSYPSYTPNNLSVTIGDTIIWKGDLESFPLFSASIPNGSPPFSSVDGKEYAYVILSAGTYKFQCPPYRTNGMFGYFHALAPNTKTENTSDSAMVYINYIAHSFHIVTPDPVPHNLYNITITDTKGKQVYKTELSPTETEKWIATEKFTAGSYKLTVTDGKHSFARNFSQ